MLINTLHLDGNADNKLHFIDHSYMPVTDRSFIGWYASDPTIRRDPYTITRLINLIIANEYVCVLGYQCQCGLDLLKLRNI